LQALFALLQADLPLQEFTPSHLTLASSAALAVPTNAVENITPVHDLHATMLYLLGVDHKRLTIKFQGRDFRLTDVAGNVIEKILA